MTPWILAVLAIYFVQTFLPSITRAMTHEKTQLQYLRGTRDDRPETPVLTARMERAQKNMMEALPIFLPLALLLEMQGITGGLATAGAATFTFARLLYPAGYASPWPLLRSAIWTVGHIGLGIMVWALLA